MKRWLPVIVGVACGLLLVLAMPSAKWERMACAGDFYSKARVKVRNMKRLVQGLPPLECAGPGSGSVFAVL